MQQVATQGAEIVHPRSNHSWKHEWVLVVEELGKLRQGGHVFVNGLVADGEGDAKAVAGKLAAARAYLLKYLAKVKLEDGSALAEHVAVAYSKKDGAPGLAVVPKK
ncbi:hypothetical protein [Thiomonas sp.]